MQLYLVGGAVRDTLLGIPVNDRDYVVVGATPEQLIAQGFSPVGRDFPVFLHPDSHEEYALARTERKQGHGYTGFVCHFAPEVTLEEDLLRRDLTINAMAQDEAGQIIDPYGGKADLELRLLRHVSAAFVEDPLRVLRVARFAARFAHLGFRVADETLTLMHEISDSGELESLTPERIWQELEKALMSPSPQVFIAVLHQCGALKRLIPELDALYGVPGPAKWHPEIDTGIHMELVLAQCATRQAPLAVRYAALCHDFGKGLTPEKYWPAHHGHDINGVPLVETASNRLKAPKAAKELALLVCREHSQVHHALELSPKGLMKLFDRADIWRRPERFEALLQACEIDFYGRANFAEQPYQSPAYLRAAYAIANAVSIQQIMADGHQGAQIKTALHERRVQRSSQWPLLKQTDLDKEGQ